MRKIVLNSLITSCVAVGILCTGIVLVKLNSEESKHSNSVLNSKITNTLSARDWDCGPGLCKPSGRYLWGMTSDVVGSLSDLKSYVPVELIGTVDDETIYVVLRINDDDIGDYYAYMFFRYIDDENPHTVKGDLDDIHWHKVGREVQVLKHLSAKDFEKIIVGSTVEDVTAINPLTCLDYYARGDYFLSSCDTFHYTDDGILRITFSRETVDDEYTVSEIELNSTFEVDPFDGNKSLEGKNPPIKLKINPEHIPN